MIVKSKTSVGPFSVLCLLAAMEAQVLVSGLPKADA
jgi:hypothetical protein